jgi:FlaA1/EpsC-like NDP-sugar epimerase
MGSPVRIIDLAEQLIRLSGLEPYKDVDIVFTGLRPGEKLNEELVAAGEETIATSAEKVRLVQRNGKSADIQFHLQRLVSALCAENRAELLQAVLALAPEYTPHVTNAPDSLAPVAERQRLTLLQGPRPVPTAHRSPLRSQPSLLGDASGA